MFYEQLNHLCQQKNIAMTTVVLSLGMSRSVVTSWKNGIIPTGETILKLAEYFHVSTDFLLTGNTNTSDLCKEEIELLHLFRNLPDIGKESVKGYIKGYISAINDSK